MTFLRIVYKFLALFYLCIKGIVVMFLLSFSDKSISPNKKQKAFREQWFYDVIKVIGLKLEVKGSEVKDTNALWVANHISWLDIVTVGSQGTAFLSKAEIRSWPLIGWLGKQAGTVFIKRGSKNAAQIASQAIADKIKSGDNVLVFPEGTTGLGNRLKPFHARIFASSLDHQLPVQAIALQYMDEQGNHHPKVTWVKQTFLSNLLGVLAQKEIRVVLTFLPVIDGNEFSERKRLSEMAEGLIKSVVEA